VRRTRLRSGLLTGALLILTAVAWWYFAPTNIGGSTSYVITRGISMEPRFHTGDLALVRPADHYNVGDVVAYHSSVLHIVVMHRIVARDGDRYVFKGDNNNFLDPSPPRRAALIGALWLRVPQGGRMLNFLHKPLTAAVLTAVVVVLMLLAGGETRRRRRQTRRNGAGGPDRHGPRLVTASDHGAGRHVDLRALLVASAGAAAAFLVLAVIAFTHPLRRAVAVNVPYTQRVSFGYSTSVPAGPVYPTGFLHTGDPIFLQLVHRLQVQIGYHLMTGAPHRLVSTEDVSLRLTGPGGWSRSIAVGAPRRFTGDRFRTQVTLDLPHLQSLIMRIQTMTGVSAGAGFTIAVTPRVHIRGVVAGQSVNVGFGSVLSFQLAGLQLVPGSGSTASGSSSGGYRPSQRGTVVTASSAPNPLTIAGDALPVPAIRWIGLLGFLLTAAATLVLLARRTQGEPFDEPARIQREHGHLLVPIVGGADDWARPPFDVSSIKALVRLAECSERLVLHHHDDGADTYLVDDEGTVYRYQTRPKDVVWGHWSVTTPKPLVSVAIPDDQAPAPADERNDREGDLVAHTAPTSRQAYGHTPRGQAYGHTPRGQAYGRTPRGLPARCSLLLRATVSSITAVRARHARASASRRRPPSGGPPTAVSPDLP
jgi:signal peptidase I